MDVAKFWVCSSPGRAPDLHSGGREFDPLQIHHLVYKTSYLLGGSLYMAG